jgi:RNA polymerase sigma factor (sigma-70 family)
MSELSDEYADVPDMVRNLKSLDENTAAFGHRREAIIRRVLPLADHVARRFKGRGEPQDDLFQVACVGVINAVNRFDPDTGADFLSTIADANYNASSIDAPESSDDESPPICETLGGPDPALDKVVDVETVRPLIAALPERERKVLALRFAGGMTQSEIAQHMGYSQMHISRLLASILNTLRYQACERDVRAVDAQWYAVSPSGHERTAAELLAAG